jgi:endonuclease/exonuclease/phosphatase family metal-dependent hydrolase
MERIRVLAANLWSTRVDAEGFAESLRYLNPDVVCIQELAPSAASVLEEMYSHGELSPTNDFRGMGIAVRNPAKLSTLEMPHNDGQVAVLEPDDWPTLNEALEIVNLHFAAPGPRHIPSQLAARRRQLAVFEEYLGQTPPRPRLVVGDMNATPAWPLYRRLTRQFDDAHRLVARRHHRTPRRTWGPTHRWPRLLRIDHVFTHAVEVSDLWVVPIAGSDHSGVVFDLA